VWSFSVRTAVKVNGVPYDRPANPYHAENDSLILGTDAIPSPGFSRVSVSSLLGHSYRAYADLGQFGICNPKGDITITTRVQGVTVGASSFFQGTAILHVLSNAIRVLEPGVFT
jgi:cleavage and polyadenylation specificity factor subunit 1